MGFLDWHLPSSDFNLAEYEHYEQVENGDLNWIVPGQHLCVHFHLCENVRCMPACARDMLGYSAGLVHISLLVVQPQPSSSCRGESSASAEVSPSQMQCGMACAGKFLAFSGPAPQPFQMGTYVTHTPEDYHRYFHLRGVKAVVRLNNQVSHLWLLKMLRIHCQSSTTCSRLLVTICVLPHPTTLPDEPLLFKLHLWRCQTYDGQRFVSGGFAMHELFFPDGSCPSDSILQRFLTIAESTPGKALSVQIPHTFASGPHH